MSIATRTDRHPLVWDLVLPELNHIICLAAKALRAVIDDPEHVLRRLAIGRVRLETITEHLDRAASETRETRVKHQGDQ